MIKLAGHSFDSLDHYRKIVASKQEARRTRLKALEEVVTKRVGQLDSDGPFTIGLNDLGHTCTRGQQEDCDPCDPCDFEDLRSLWSSTKARDDLVDELSSFYKQQSPSCPGCSVNNANTTDHYLPQAKFPEFTVVASNLFPLCSECNGLKKDHVPGADGRCLHPTLDELDTVVLKCDIVGTSSAPRPEFGVDRGVARHIGLEDEWVFHFERLKLGERLSEAAVPLLAEFLSQFDRMPAVLRSDAATIAQTQADVIREVSGANSYRAALFEGVSTWI